MRILVWLEATLDSAEIMRVECTNVRRNASSCLARGNPLQENVRVKRSNMRLPACGSVGPAESPVGLPGVTGQASPLARAPEVLQILANQGIHLVLVGRQCQTFRSQEHEKLVNCFVIPASLAVLSTGAKCPTFDGSLLSLLAFHLPRRA